MNHIGCNSPPRWDSGTIAADVGVGGQSLAGGMSGDVGQRALLLATAILLSGGLFHTFVWIASGESLAGPVSWRKPILFCFSSGVTCLSLSWVQRILVWRQKTTALLGLLFAVAICIEVTLICVQIWRGVPAHFYASSQIDYLVLESIKFQALLITALIGFFTFATFQKLATTADYAFAARAGMLLLLFSCLLGIAVELHGEWRLMKGLSPELVGRAGLAKFPHGMPMHAIQLLPMVAFVLARLGRPLSQRLYVVRTTALGIVGLTLYAILQTLFGLPRLAFSYVTGVVLLASLSLLLIAALSSLQAKPAK